MKSMYCSSCGAKMEYQVSPPNFCSSCGAQIGGAVASKPLEDRSEGDADIEISKFSGLQYEISQPFQKESLGEVLASESKGSSFKRPRTSDDSDPIQKSIDECKPSKGHGQVDE